MNRRLGILSLVLIAGFSLVYLLPASPGIQESAVRMDLPGFVVSGWSGGPDETDFSKEKAKLANDTEFRRKNYFRPSESGDGSVDMLQATIVLSGRDMNNSLHRPERCLPVQGFTVRQSNTLTVPLAGNKEIKVTRLICDGMDARSSTSYTHMNYYFFIGHNTVAGNHWDRTFTDIKDRVVSGYDQRWAYVTVGMNLMKGKIEDGMGQVQVSQKRTEAEADAMVTEFIKDLVPDIVQQDEVKIWE